MLTLCSGFYLVKHEFCIQQKPICVMLKCQIFKNESESMDTNTSSHTYQIHEIEMIELEDFFHETRSSAGKIQNQV